jgi:uncharacterized phage-associated protein
MSSDKFKAAAHYVLSLANENPERLGAIRLNKVLWYADSTHMKLYGEPLTGATYVKRRMGPVPKRILATVDALQEDGAIEVVEPRYQFDVRTYKLKRPMSSNVLSEEEMALLRSMYEMVSGLSANAVSEETHDDLWESIHEGGEIPLYATLASHRGAITPEVAAWAQEIVTNKQDPISSLVS